MWNVFCTLDHVSRPVASGRAGRVLARLLFTIGSSPAVSRLVPSTDRAEGEYSNLAKRAHIRPQGGDC